MLWKCLNTHVSVQVMHLKIGSVHHQLSAFGHDIHLSDGAYGCIPPVGRMSRGHTLRGGYPAYIPQLFILLATDKVPRLHEVIF